MRLTRREEQVFEIPGRQVIAALSSLNIESGRLRSSHGRRERSRGARFAGAAQRITAQSAAWFDVERETVYPIRLNARDRVATQEALGSMLVAEDAILRMGEAALARQYEGVVNLPTPPGEPQRTIPRADFEAEMEANIRDQLVATRELSIILAGAQA